MSFHFYRAVFVSCCLPCCVAVGAGETQGEESNGKLDIYWTDVEGGAATLIVTPAGEAVLVDTGMPGDRDPARILDTVKRVAGRERIDYLVVTHFDIDHYGGTADLAREIPIGAVYDPGLPTDKPKLMDRLGDYLEATEGKRTVIAPGDRIPLRQPESAASKLELFCLAAAQSFIAPRDDQKTPNPHCEDSTRRQPDTSQNANSVVLLLSFGAFRFFDGADLTWNLEGQLVCPHNLVGPVDVFQIDHHGLDMSNNPVLVRSLEPQVVIFNNGPVKGCGPASYRTVRETPSVEAIYQLHRNVRAGPEGNTLPRRIANVHADCQAAIVQVSVAPDGRAYDVLIPAKGLRESFETRRR